MTNEKNFSCYTGAFASISLIVLIFLIYSNSFYASWHMDDYHNITYNTQVHIKNLQPSSLFETFFFQDGKSKKLSRPFSRLTLAINWYFGKASVAGYHLVNVLIHFLTAFILFMTVYKILKLPNLRDRYRGNEYFIALLTSILWAINPIQTQAVTYIVQRMASLSTMFYILSIFFYIKGRIAHPHSKKVVLFFFCFLSFLLALASKENAATLPLALMLAEAVFFQDLSRPEVRKTFILGFLIGGFFLILLGTIFMRGNPLLFLEAYNHRPFSLCQRLMTEPRVLVLYLTQIFYPVPTRLSIEHDISISTSLLHPWTTIPSMVIIFVLIGLGFSQMKKRPILGFGILFFFLNHVIESSILGLELVFEHRNYLPSLFLFFPIAVGIRWLIDYYSARKRFMYYILISFFTLLLIGLGSGTYIRNMAWATEKTLWEDAMRKAPKSARPSHNLAWGHYEILGHYDRAMELYRKSLPLKWHSLTYRSDAFYGMAGIYYKIGEYEKAVEFYKKALRIDPEDEMSYKQLAMSFLKQRKWDEASEIIDFLVMRFPEEVKYQNLKSFLLLKDNKPEDALPYLKKCLKLDPYYQKAMINIGAALSAMGVYGRAEWFLRVANLLHPRDILTLLWLIEINLRANDKEDVELYMDELFTFVHVDVLVSVTETLFKHSFIVPISTELLTQEIAGKLGQKSEEIEELAVHIKRQDR